MSSTKTDITLWIKVHLTALEVENVGDEMSSHWNQYWMLTRTTSASLFCSSGWKFKLSYLIIWDSYNDYRTLKINIYFYLCYMTLSSEMGFLLSPKLPATKPKKRTLEGPKLLLKCSDLEHSRKVSLAMDSCMIDHTHLKGIKR